MLPIPPNTEVVDFCLNTAASPHFAGADDPIAMLALLGSGELITMSFPSGFPVSPTNQLHVSATFVHPFITYFNLSPVQRVKWLGMTEVRSSGPQLLAGGAPAARPMKRFKAGIRASCTCRRNRRALGCWPRRRNRERIRFGDRRPRAVGKPEGIEVTHTSLSGASGELAVGTKSGEVVLASSRRTACRRAPAPRPAGRGHETTSSYALEPASTRVAAVQSWPAL